MLAVVDYDAGNLRSVARAVEHAGGVPKVTCNPRDVFSGYIHHALARAAADAPRLALKAHG